MKPVIVVDHTFNENALAKRKVFRFGEIRRDGEVYRGVTNSRLEELVGQAKLLTVPDLSTGTQILKADFKRAVKQCGINLIWRTFDRERHAYESFNAGVRHGNRLAISCACTCQTAFRGIRLFLSGFRSELGSISTLSHWPELNRIDYRLRDSCNGKYRSKENQNSIGIFTVSKKNYKLLGFSEQLSNPDDKFDWGWLPLGVAGFICLIWGIFVFYTKSMTLGMVMFIVGWVCSQIGFARWFN